MAKKQFKTESKKLLDMMINSIYTHKEIFMRELISNASDAIDKRHFRSLTDSAAGLNFADYAIQIDADKENRVLKICDNGCGMTKDELENNLGTIAKSGSYDFKANPENSDENIDIIGQFGVGFYSAFMVCGKVVVETKSIDSEEAYRWESSGVDGYTVDTCEKNDAGTCVTLYLKEDTEDENYSIYLDEYKIRELIKTYSDYIRYPIKTLVSKSRSVETGETDENGKPKTKYETYTENETINSMIPLWKKSQSEVSDEEYNNFYRDKFYDYEAPLKIIRQKAEGVSEYTALLFIPSHAPFDYYSRDFEKGLQLYSRGVLIMDKCKELLPDYFSFVRGLVDSSDLSLNISRETLQQDRQVKHIAKTVEKKISAELKKMLEGDRDSYKKFYTAFGSQLKWGLYSEYGAHKETLQDLIMFKSSFNGDYVTLKEYVERMKDGQDKIYYAAGESIEKISLLPQVESVIAHDYEVMYLTDEVDEFALQMLHTYMEKEFLNVCKNELDLSTDEEKEALKAENEKASDMLELLKESLDGAVTSVRFTNTLQKHAVCLSSEGMLSVEMEKALNRAPGNESHIKAELVLEINMNHPIKEKLLALFENDKEKLSAYGKILYSQARLISGMSVENPAEISELIFNMMLEK